MKYLFLFFYSFLILANREIILVVDYSVTPEGKPIVYEFQPLINWDQPIFESAVSYKQMLFQDRTHSRFLLKKLNLDIEDKGIQDGPKVYEGILLRRKVLQRNFFATHNLSDYTPPWRIICSLEEVGDFISTCNEEQFVLKQDTATRGEGNSYFKKSQLDSLVIEKEELLEACVNGSDVGFGPTETHRAALRYNKITGEFNAVLLFTNHLRLRNYDSHKNDSRTYYLDGVHHRTGRALGEKLKAVSIPEHFEQSKEHFKRMMEQVALNAEEEDFKGVCWDRF